MGIKIKNLQTGEFEKFNIPALKGEKGEPGEVEPSEKVDYIGKQHSKLRDTMNANVDYIIKTAIGEFNYLDYEGQHITATNSIEGHAKSAILSGRTEVTGYSYNGYMLNNHGILSANGELTTVGTSGWSATDSLIKLESGEYYIEDDGTSGDGYTYVYFYTENGEYLDSKSRIDVGVSNTFNIDDLSYVKLSRRKSSVNHLKIYRKDDLKLTSVKMPVLTTTGKNFEQGSPIGNFTENNGEYVFTNMSNRNGIRFDVDNTMKIGDTITVSVDCKKNEDFGNNLILLAMNNDVELINKSVPFSMVYERKSLTITIPDNTTHLFLGIGTSLRRNVSFNNIQIEKGSVSTPYEPYKTNILTVNEDVELRGIGDAKDTVNCLTGEVVENTIKLTFSGIENWETSANLTNYMTFRLAKPSNMITADSHSSASKYVCNKLQVVSSNTVGSTEIEAIWFSSGHMYIRLPKTKASSLEEFKTYLSTNNIQVVSCAKQPVVKTVDLSDNHVYSYKDTTHYACSSEEGSLVPTLSVKVPTDTQLTIQEQKATTQTLLIKNMDLQQSIKEVQAMNLAFNTALYNSFNSIREEVEDIKKHVSTNENLEGSF